MTVRIKNRDFVLSQRRAADVLNLAAAIQKQGEPDTIMNLLSMARVVCDSLKSTYLKLGRIRGWRYHQFIVPGGTAVLLDQLSTEDIMMAYAAVFNIEGSKKKVEQMERLFQERSPGDSLP